MSLITEHLLQGPYQCICLTINNIKSNSCVKLTSAPLYRYFDEETGKSCGTQIANVLTDVLLSDMCKIY